MRYTFTEWSGDYTDTALNGSVTMNEPKYIRANWGTQFELTLATEYGSPYGYGWYFEADTALSIIRLFI